MTRKDTAQQILQVAGELAAQDGLGGISFDAISGRLGITKQAVLYWFPSKRDLLAALFLPWLEAEANAAIDATERASSENDAIAFFVRAVARFHVEDLNRFRMMYLVPQTTRGKISAKINASILEKVHPITDQLYESLASHLNGNATANRRAAFAIHTSVIGMIVMHGLTQALDDPAKHTLDDQIEALIRRMST